MFASLFLELFRFFWSGAGSPESTERLEASEEDNGQGGRLGRVFSKIKRRRF